MTKFMLAVVVSISITFSGMSFADETRNVEPLNSGKIIPPSFEHVRVSEAVRLGDTIYISGMIGILPGTTTLVPGGIKEETKQTMENIKTILEAHGYSMNNIAKCTVILANISEWEAFNEVWASYFPNHAPARSAFGGNDLGFGSSVEVDCIAAAD